MNSERPQRVAICLSGHLRTYGLCYDSIKRHLLDPYFPKADFFLHTWDRLGVGDRDDHQEVEQLTADHLDRFKMLYYPKRYAVEEQRNFLTPEFTHLADRFARPHGYSIAMFYSLAQSIALKRAYEIDQGFRYDIVVRLRPDTYFYQVELERPLDLAGRVIVPYWGNSGLPEWHYYNSINDQFFIADSAGSDCLGQTYNNLAAMCALGCPYHPESLLKWQADVGGLKVEYGRFRYILRRGTHPPENDLPACAW